MTQDGGATRSASREPCAAALVGASGLSGATWKVRPAEGLEGTAADVIGAA